MNENQEIVHIVDDEEKVRSAMSFLLNSYGYSTVEYSSARDFLDKYKKNHIECLLLDIMMPEMLGTELFFKLPSKNIVLPCIFVSAHGTIDIAVDMVQKGAFNFISKPAEPLKLHSIIKKAFDNCKEIRGSSLEIESFKKKAKLLSKKENEAYTHMISNASILEMANAMHISKSTVEIHRSNVLAKLGFKSTIELHTFCIKHNIQP